MIPFQTTDWDNIPSTKHTGETGVSYWKTLQYKNIRVRFVEYSAGYKADHWCEKGHLVLCVEGEFTSHMKDGSQHHLKKGDELPNQRRSHQSPSFYFRSRVHTVYCGWRFSECRLKRS